jgi:hypothetical protein
MDEASRPLLLPRVSPPFKEDKERRGCDMCPEWLPMLVCFLFVGFVVAWLFISGRVFDVVNWLHENRGVGFAVIILLYLPIGTPFAFGYSVLTAASGFVYGFPLGIVPVIVGANLSIASSYFIMRCGRPPAAGTLARAADRSWPSQVCIDRFALKERIEAWLAGNSTNESVKKWTRVALKALSRRPFVSVLLMRLTPLLFGAQNSMSTFILAFFCGRFHALVSIQPCSPYPMLESAPTYLGQRGVYPQGSSHPSHLG